MTYWNPVERYGVERFAADLANAGGAGLITPDLTPDSARGVDRRRGRPRPRQGLPGRALLDRRAAALHHRGLPRLRLRHRGHGRHRRPGDAPPTSPARWSRAPARCTDLPVGVGLGVSNGDQAAEVASYADAVIVGLGLRARPARRGRPCRAGWALAALTEDLAAGVRRGWRSCAVLLAVAALRRVRLLGVGVRRLPPSPGITVSDDDGYHGILLDEPYAVPACRSPTPRASRSTWPPRTAHPRLLRLHQLPRHLPGRDEHDRLGGGQAVPEPSATRCRSRSSPPTRPRDTRQVLRTYLDRFNPAFVGAHRPARPDRRAGQADGHLHQEGPEAARAAATRSTTPPSWSAVDGRPPATSSGPAPPRRRTWPSDLRKILKADA